MQQDTRHELDDLTPEMFRHSTPVQLRFNDIDILGHVNNNSQFAIFDVGKTQFYNSLRGQLDDWRRVEAVIANINCTFHRQILFSDEVEVRTRITRIGERSFTMQQIIYNRTKREISSLADSVMVSVDFETKQSKPIPEPLVEALRKWI